MKCYWCVKEFQNKRRKILNVKEAITIYDGKGLCAKHLKAVESVTQKETLADRMREQNEQQRMALANRYRGLEGPYGGTYGQLGYHYLMFGRR